MEHGASAPIGSFTVNFLIFVTAFVVLACVVLPLGVLAVFAAMRDPEAGVKAAPEDRPPPASRQTVIT